MNAARDRLAYHRVPDGWYREQLLAEHRRLGGSFAIDGADAVEPGAPAWLPERHAWLQYRATLYRVADGVRAGDRACIELAVRYIVLRYIGSYSGFIRERLARALKSAPLDAGQVARLHAHFSALAVAGVRTQEFGTYLPLWRRLIGEDEREALRTRLAAGANGAASAAWWMEKLRR